MPAIKLEKFGGELPGWDPKTLPDGQAAASKNGYMFTGALQGWRTPKLLRSLTNPLANFAYRIPATTFDTNGNAIFDTTITNTNQTWIESLDPDSTVVRSQIPNDTFQRYYYAAPTNPPPIYNTLARIQSSQPFFQLGIPQPAAAPVVSVTGGGSLATIGPTTSVGGAPTVNSNVIYLLPIVPTGAVLIDSISFMPDATNASCSFFACVYADAAVGGNVATTPGALLGQTPVVTGITQNILSTGTFSNPIGLDVSTPYWIGICLNSAEAIFAGDGVNSSGYFLATFSNGAPAFAGPLITGQPDLQMFATVTTSGVIESRAYVYTYISAYGEEGPPSEPTVLTGFSNGSWTITPTFPPSNYLGQSGTGNIAILRIYRTVTSSAGTATYFQVQDISVNSPDPDAVNAVTNDALGCIPFTATYTDPFPDSTVALNLILESTNYFPPPTNLQGIIVMPNGMYAGWTGQTVWFCQPYLPHAWPPGFSYTVDAPIVGMAVTMGALVVVTVGTPWTFSGTNPAAMSQVHGSFPEPCKERGSIIGTDLGVFYKSINGLIQVVNSGSMSNYTETWITREKWNAETPTNYTRAIPLLGSYFAFGSVSPPGSAVFDDSQAQIGLTIELNVDNTSFSIWPQPGGHRIGFNQLEAPNGFNINNCQLDPWTGIGLIIQNGEVFYYDFTDTNPAMQVFDWTSKIYQQNTKRSFEAFRVWFTNPTNLSVPGLRNTAVATDPSWQSLSANAWLYVLIYADVDDGNGDGSMMLVTAREVQRSGELLRIQDGFKTENWQVRLIGRVPVSNMQMATSAKELANV